MDRLNSIHKVLVNTKGLDCKIHEMDIRTLLLNNDMKEREITISRLMIQDQPQDVASIVIVPLSIHR